MLLEMPVVASRHAHDIEIGFNFNNNTPNGAETRDHGQDALHPDSPRATSRRDASRRGGARRPQRAGRAGAGALKEAATRVLERVGYRQMRVSDVTGEAGVATGLFYHYFPDLKALTIEVLGDFMTRFEALEEIERGVAKGDWYARSHAHNRLVVQQLRAQPGHHALHGATR